MAEIVFLRGVNVGGARTFQPSKLARELAAFDVVSIGAAGTFVARGRVARRALHEELRRRLPFSAQILGCNDKELSALVAAPPFRGDAPARDEKWYVSVVDKAIKGAQLPLDTPPADWQVRVVATVGRFVCSLHRRRGRTLVYPNEVVERAFGVTATTRNWSTILSIARLLS
jgi:uncharacterized protein (DUF1697 family)